MKEIKQLAQEFMSLEVQHAVHRAVLDEVVLQIECPSGFEFFAVFGPPGAGKSTVCQTICARALDYYNSDLPPNPGELPVVLVTAPAAPRRRPDWKELFCRVLEELNRPLATAPSSARYNPGFGGNASLSALFGKGSTQGVRRALRDAIEYRKVRLILIDEGQHVTKGLNREQVSSEMDNLKNLAQETQCLIGLVGTYDLLPLITASGQLSRRVTPVHYLNRLGAAHGIAATSLCRNIVFPNMGRSYSSTSTQIPFVGSRAARLLFPNAPSIALTKALGTLTGQSGFDRAITMNLAELVQLGHHVRRGWWWCPLCMQQWMRSGQPLHFPLLWNVSTHSVCLEHEVSLIGDCPNCRLQFTQMRESNWSAQCRRCQQSLIGECVRRPSVKVDHQSWAWLASVRTKQLFEWIADGKQISSDGFRRNISSAITAMGGPSAFARTLNMNYQSVMRWDQGVHRPRFASLIRLSVTFGISVQEIVETEINWTASLVPVNGLPGKMYQGPLWRCSAVVETALAKAVSSEDAGPESLTRLCKRFGVAVYSVRRRFPNLSKKLITKHRRHLRAVSLTNRHERTSRLNSLVREIEQNGRRCTRYHLRMLMRERGEKQMYQMLRLFDERLTFKENRMKPSRIVRGAPTYGS